jgi:hypothetical protein
MSTFKRISGDYTIQSVNTTDRIFINSGNVFIEGNLWVSGNTQTISSTNMELNNNQIVMNAGTTIPNPSGASIVVSRGSSGQSNSEIIWNESISAWQITTVVSGTYGLSNIATTSQTGAFLATVSQDPTPALGGNLNITSHYLYDTSANVQIYAGVTGGGGTGLHVTNPIYSNVEVISKNKSMIYSIIFG